MEIILLSLKILSIISGMVLCYLAIFTYEDEDSLVQSTLEQWWVRVDDLKHMYISKHLAFMKVTSELALAMIERFFGSKTISLRTISVAACLSLASLRLTTAFIQNDHYILKSMFLNAFLIEAESTYTEARFSAFMLDSIIRMVFIPLGGIDEPISYASPLLILSLLAVLVPAITKRLHWLPTVTILIFAASGIPTYSSKTSSAVLFSPSLMTSITICIGILFDIIAISSVRYLLHYQARLTSLAGTLILTIAQLISGLGLILIPLIVGTYGIMDIPFTLTIEGNLLRSILLSSVTNIFGAVTFFSIFAAGMMLLIHRLIWPVVTRLLYRLVVLYKTPSMKVALCSLGIGMISIGLGLSKTSFQALLNKYWPG